ncbi:PorT family protein [Parabacteroides sp. 52]|uniref:porin family protein n=1 Tax=unclassified Parabacteroides TaxID=2649774 RepID=UPI0013D4E7BA|nr:MULTISPECIES: porin family protein [unclassified Parabacteroides]MDH6533671.1 hypothetical protein [Parabacteroides sp. PM5-20]NDV54423.1 PorT family protein [Parabacteroides sp. 52]
MKKAIGLIGILVCMVCMVTPAHAQIRFGVKGGVNISTVHFNSSVLDGKNVTGFHVGPMIEATLPLLGVGLDLAVLYNQKGVEIDDLAIKIDYIDVPLHLKWKFGLPFVKAYLATGPYVGFQVSGDKVWKGLADQVKSKTFGVGWDFGVGAEVFNHLQVGVNYGLGLTDDFSVFMQDGIRENGKNRGWAITAAILF